MKKILVILSFVCLATAAGAQSATDLRVDTAASSIKWDAKKVVGGHVGTINIKEGTVGVEGNRLTGGAS